MNRREFISTGLTAAAATAVGANDPLKKPLVPMDKLIWATRYQLGYGDQVGDKDPLNAECRYSGAKMPPFDEASFWRRVKDAKEAGVNMLVVAVMEALKYPSHPEIAEPGAVAPEKLYDMMKRVREEFGMATVPELNFATTHDVWLGVYSRMVSTPQYYKVCADLLKDVYDVFGHPAYINFGMDEENSDCSQGKNYALWRKGDLYWHDNRFYIDTIEKLGARSWCWADKWWWGSKEFIKNVPKSCLLSNWYYCSTCDVDEIRKLGEKAKDPKMANLFIGYVSAFEGMEKAGYDQLPAGAYWLDRLDKAAGLTEAEATAKNMPSVVRHCTKLIDPSRLKGFLCGNWLHRGAGADNHWKRFMTPIPAARAEYAKMGG